MIDYFKIIKKDDIFSVNNQPTGVDPIEGFSLSPLIELKIAKKLSLKTETAVSLHTKNQLSESLPFEEEVPDFLLDINSHNINYLAKKSQQQDPKSSSHWNNYHSDFSYKNGEFSGLIGFGSIEKKVNERQYFSSIEQNI